MSTKLAIHWDGDVPGLREHALSVAAWHDALGKLLAAIRRTASGLASDALNDPAYGARGGRLTRDAGEIDLHIVELKGGSLELGCVAHTPARQGQQDLFMRDLPGRALNRVLDDIEHEAKGEPRNVNVRRFLQACPPGLTAQRYTLEVDGKVQRDVRVGAIQVAELPPSLVGLRRVEGQIVALGFEPGSPSITIKTGNRSVVAAASPEQVEGAYKLRGQPVVAMLVEGRQSRVLWLRLADEPLEVRSAGACVADLNQRWAATLERLAQ